MVIKLILFPNSTLKEVSGECPGLSALDDKKEDEQMCLF
jgi:hypothetical protein